MSDFIPYRAVHPGEIIADDMKELNITQAELSRKTGIPKSVLNDVIKGRRDINPEMAILIADVIGYTPQMLLAMQSNYDLDRARISERVLRQQKANSTWDVLKDFVSIDFFKRAKVLKGNVVDDVKIIMGIFGADSIDKIISLNADEIAHAYYRKSEVLSTDQKVLFSWKYYCYYLSESVSMDTPFNKDGISNLVTEINALIRENKDTVKRTRNLLESYGIRFMIVPKYGQMPVDGFAFWKGDNPTIVLTLRKKTIDNFSFTLLHELGHLYLHLDKDGFADVDIDSRRDKREDEADEFAHNSVIPSSAWDGFIRKKYSPFEISSPIKDLAERYEVNPQVLLGRYKFCTSFYKIRSPFRSDIDGCQ